MPLVLPSPLQYLLIPATLAAMLSACGGGGSGATLTSSSPAPIIRASVGTSGAEGTQGSVDSSISANGRYIAFESDANNLTNSDTRARDIFIRDVSTGTTSIISLDSNGDEPLEGASFQSSISGTGRYVAFSSTSPMLTPDDTSPIYDIFVRDRQTNTLSRVSLGVAGVEGNDFSQEPHISSDGRHIAFLSAASNLVNNDTNDENDIFMRDTQTNQTTRISVDSAGLQAINQSSRLSMASEGRYVAFTSSANNLVVGDSNGDEDVFLRDSQSGATTRVSVDSLGREGNGNSGSELHVSADGRFVAFSSEASNLVTGDNNGVQDIFIHDTNTNTTARVSVHSNTSEANGDSGYPTVSADGRYVAFLSSATNLVDTDSNGFDDVFVHDTQLGTTARIVNASGDAGNAHSFRPRISANGKYVSFDSFADNFVDNDSNMQSDVFRARTPK